MPSDVGMLDRFWDMPSTQSPLAELVSGVRIRTRDIGTFSTSICAVSHQAKDLHTVDYTTMKAEVGSRQFFLLV